MIKIKILIVTIHDIGNNFGSTLQSTALCEFIRLNGYEAEILNYLPSKKSLKEKLKLLLVNTLFLPYFIRREKEFNRYYSEHARLSSKYSSYEELNKKPPYADVYIIGSDQVWNPSFPCGKDPAYYLEFTDSPNKMSFASSLGRLLDKQEINILKNRISNFKYISVRENASQKQLIEAGLENVENVFDPVFLFSKEYYLQKRKPNKIGKYLLVYAINTDPFLEEIAYVLSKRLNLKIILIGGFRKKCKCSRFYRSAGPEDFLNLINNAEFILISSFHGVALSLILNKQFAVIQPKINSLRIENILDEVKLNDRIIKKIDDLNNVNYFIDYERVNKSLDSIRLHSKTYLLNAIKEFEKGV